MSIMLKFKLIDKCWQKATEVSSDDVDFFLEKNEWAVGDFHTTWYNRPASIVP